VRTWTTHDEHLVVYCVVQNLAEIDALVFLRIRLQKAYAHKIWVLGI